MTVVIGDPLCAPIDRRRLTRAEIDEGIDTATGLPTLFARRRIAVVKAAFKDMPDRAAQQLVRGDSLLARKDTAGARAAFEEVVKLAPAHVGAHMQLAILHDSAGEHEAAAQRYRRVLELQPNNALALNNLAYGLAVHQKNLAEALPLAQRAVKLTGDEPSVLDTLAWIEYLTGDTTSATARIAVAVKGAPDNADVRMHAAVINAAAGARAVAETQLKEAIKLNPALESSPEAKQVRALLDKLASPK
jgi:Flp pilus assembly protein TadD